MLFLVIYLAVAFLISSTMLVLTLMESGSQYEKPSSVTSLALGLIFPALWPISIPAIIVALAIDGYVKKVAEKSSNIMLTINSDVKRLKELSLADLQYLYNAGKVKAIHKKVAKEVGLELMNRLADKHLLE